LRCTILTFPLDTETVLVQNGIMQGIEVKRLQPRFVQLCWDWIASHHGNKAMLAKAVDSKAPRISELLSGKRIVTMYYIQKFILGGIFTVEAIYDGLPESEAESLAWTKLKLFNNDRVMEALAAALNSGKITEEDIIVFIKIHESAKQQ